MVFLETFEGIGFLWFGGGDGGWLSFFPSVSAVYTTPLQALVVTQLHVCKNIIILFDVISAQLQLCQFFTIGLHQQDVHSASIISFTATTNYN